MRPRSALGSARGWGLVVAVWCGWVVAVAVEGGQPLPDRSWNLRLAAPITTWDEALPLGNGLLGGLLWGEGEVLRLSLDRGDLWDERPAPGDPLSRFTYAEMVRLVGEGRNDAIGRVADRDSYDQKHPTKIPAGRLEIRLGGGRRVSGFELNLGTAEGWARLEGGIRVETMFAATERVALVRIPGEAPVDIGLKAPESVRQLGYPAAVPGGEGEERWFVQETLAGVRYAVVVRWARVGEGTLVAVTVGSSVDGGDPLERAREQVTRALGAGYDALAGPHRAWWERFWSRSRVEVPDLEVQRQYALVQYFYGAASRLGAPPMPLQGVWTADAGTLPPWKGDYHHDLNTQMTYMGYQAAGRFDEGRCFLEFLWERLPVFRKFAREFFGTPGANVPGVMTLAGAPLGGWAQYSLSPTSAGWLAHLFYLHWRYTADEAFLRERAYPWCSEIGESLAALLRKDGDGRWVLPTSSSPEIHDNTQRAWMKPNTNYDLAILRMLFLSLREMAVAAGKGGEAGRWETLAEGLGGYHVDPNGTLRLNAEESLTSSHRHFSNLMGLYPFNLTTSEGGERDREMIRASLAQYDALGTKAWCGYSFSWMAALRARVGDAEGARTNLSLFVRAFVLRNGFHANGDQTRSGLSDFTYRPFTLEGNFLAAAAVHEMLLQSWSSHPGRGDAGVIRVFPAVPQVWKEAAFDDLRVEGGHRVSARRERGETVWLRVEAGPGGGKGIRIRDNFGSRQPHWSRDGVRKVDGDYVVDLGPGEGVEAVLTPPGAGLPTR